MTDQAEAFLTGGSGLLGSHIISRLVSEGVSVRALARSDLAVSTVKALGATPHRGDLFDEGALLDGVRGVDLVYHLGGVNETCTRDSGYMDRVNIEGTKMVLAAASEAGVRRVVYTSSAATIGERRGEWGDEGSEHTGEYHSLYARSKYLAEIAAFDRAERLGVDLVVVNPSSVQGPGRSTGSAELLLRVLNSDRPILVDTMISIVDIEDCTTGHINAAKYGASGERYLLSGATFSVSDAVEMLSVAVGRELNPRWLSRGLLRIVGIPASRLVDRLKPSMGVCPELIRTLLHGHRFDGSKAVRELHISYRDASDTIGRTVEWFKDEGLA